MKRSNHILLTLSALVLVSALYRLIPGRPMGFAPQLAIAIFSGALFYRDKKWAFAMPLLSMFISDMLFEVLFRYNVTTMKGIYEGQVTNYILLTAMSCFGFMAGKLKLAKIALATFSAPTTYFLLSNFFVWFSGVGGLQRPQTMEGLMLCYNDALPFYQNNLIATALFASLFFGTWAIARAANKKLASA